MDGFITFGELSMSCFDVTKPESLLFEFQSSAFERRSGPLERVSFKYTLHWSTTNTLIRIIE